MRRVFVAMAIAAAALISGCGEPKDELIHPKDQQAVDAATQEARTNLPAFWAAFDAAASKQDFVMKVGLQTRAGGIEHIWMNVERRDGDKVSGNLANDPVDIEGVKFGSKVTVTGKQITDWAYPKNGKFYGHFTTRILMPQMPQAEREQTQALLWPTTLEQAAR